MKPTYVNTICHNQNIWPMVTKYFLKRKKYVITAD